MRPESPQSTDLPRADPLSLAARLLHIKAPSSVNDSPPHYKVGDLASFWLEDSAGSRAYTVNAVLRCAGQHSWVYLQERAQTAGAAISRSGEDFDTLAYPEVTRNVGPPTLPGIDDYSRITILLADLHGMGGYFNEIDAQPASIERISNQRKMIYLDLASSKPGTTVFNGYMAHEFQHLVNHDRNPHARAWINEGLSELMRQQIIHSLVNIPAYGERPDTQLNDWSTLDDGSTPANYGSAARAYLAHGGYGLSFEDVFADWLAANLINDPAGSRFGQNDASACVRQRSEVYQFGARYYALEPGASGISPYDISVRSL